MHREFTGPFRKGNKIVYAIASTSSRGCKKVIHKKQNHGYPQVIHNLWIKNAHVMGKSLGRTPVYFSYPQSLGLISVGLCISVLRGFAIDIVQKSTI